VLRDYVIIDAAMIPAGLRNNVRKEVFMSTPEQIRRDAESALKDVNRLQSELLDFPELHLIKDPVREVDLSTYEDIEEFRNRVAELLDGIYTLLEGMKDMPVKERQSNEILPLFALAQELTAQIDWLGGVLARLDSMMGNPVPASEDWLVRQIQGPVKSAISKIRSYLIPLVKKFLAKLLSIISGLLTPKEWKLKGKAGTGLLGLADVEVEVTFGP
jgi:hypothetical protein